MPGLITVRRHPAGFFEGRAQPGSGRCGEIMASFLQSDIQGDLETARMLLAEIAAGARSQAGSAMPFRSRSHPTAR
jgi:hypothetical protein